MGLQERSDGRSTRVLVAWLSGALLAVSGVALSAEDSFWSTNDLSEIKKLALSSLPPLSPDPTNRVADDPRAAELGERLFFDAGFSADGTVSCATCHQPDRQFQDGLRVGHGIGEANRRTPPLAGVAYQPFFFWDGRKDSLWSQALGPLENPVEHGADRTMIVQRIASEYIAEFEDLFGPLPELGNLPPHAAPSGTAEAVAAWAALSQDQQHAVNETFADMGKAIEAYERTLPVPVTRFDAFANAVLAGDEAGAGAIFSEAERNGLKLFLNQGDCVRCHSGPQFTDMQFYNISLPGTSEATDAGRIAAAHMVAEDPFNCLGEYSDNIQPPNCARLKLLRFDMPNQMGAFKSPSLRGVAQRPPYTHTGQFATLREVLEHYNKAPAPTFGKSQLRQPLELTEVQMGEIDAFLHTLDVDEAGAN